MTGQGNEWVSVRVKSGLRFTYARYLGRDSERGRASCLTLNEQELCRFSRNRWRTQCFRIHTRLHTPLVGSLTQTNQSG